MLGYTKKRDPSNKHTNTVQNGVRLFKKGHRNAHWGECSVCRSQKLYPGNRVEAGTVRCCVSKGGS